MVSRIAGELLVDLALQYLVPLILREATGGAQQRVRAEAPRAFDRDRARPAQLRLVSPPGRPGLLVLSRTPGRLRVRVERLRGNSAWADALTEPLYELAGVHFVRANPLTGAILIEFDPATQSEAALLAALQSSGAPPVANPAATGDPSGSSGRARAKTDLVLVGI
jgi:hypothetical protein